MSLRGGIVWSVQAVDDLADIYAYVARTSPQYASVLATRLIDAVDRLRDFPESGRVLPELADPAVREVIHGSYRVVYELRAEQAEILTVFRASRLFPGLDHEEL